jgi:hypothetical protein
LAESPFRERRYSPVEVRALVRRAADIAARPSAGAPTGTALTPREIEDRAAELGIPPAAFRLALEEAEAPKEAEPQAETPGRIVIEEYLAADASTDEILDVLRDETRDVGATEVVGETITWRPLGARRRRSRRPQLSVRIRRKDGRTEVRIEERLWPGKVIGWAGVALPIAGAGGVNALIHPLIAGHIALAFVLFAAVMIVAATLGWSVSTAITSYRTRKVKDLAKRLRHEFAHVGTESVRARVDTTADAATGVRVSDAENAEDPEVLESDSSAVNRAR